MQISVIIPCYNYDRFLPDAVASVVAQTIGTWEMLIVDDGSTDQTLPTAQTLAAHYSSHRIRVFSQPNRGVAAARNAGARYANGTYLLFLDADDMLQPTMLERAAAILDAAPALGFVYSGFICFGRDQHVWPSVPFDRQALALDNFVPPPALLRRIAWEQIGGFDTTIIPGWEDWDFWLRLSANWPGYHIPEPLVYYRWHGLSLSRRQAARAWDARAQIMRKHPDLYGPRLRAWATRRCAQRGLPATPQLQDFYQHGVHEVESFQHQAYRSDTFKPYSPASLSQRDGRKVPMAVHQQWLTDSGYLLGMLQRRLLRKIPFSLRIRARWLMRHTQHLLLAGSL